VTSSNNENIETRVLVFAPTGRDAELTCAFLNGAKMQAEKCRDMAEVVLKTEEGCGAILLAEETLGATSVQILSDLLMQQPSWSEIPICIIAVGGPGNRDTSRRLTVFGNTGNVTVLERPFRPDTLVNTLKVALRSRHRQYQVRDLVRAVGESEARYRELAASLETQVKVRTAALEETNKEMEAFTYTIAHDLRAPLRAQESFSSTLLVEFGDVLGEKGRDYAQRITHSALRLNELVQDLLQFSRLSRAEIKIGTVDLRCVVLRVCEEMQFDIKEANAQVDIQQFSSRVCGHEATLETVITNLLSNAIKFCKRDVPHIQIYTEDRHGFVRLTVEDNGIGIAPEHYEQVFGIFNRLHKAGEFPGTGIGLAIVKRGVERMSGRVGVQSQEGVGTKFWIELEKMGCN
jgi:signal transduction histidine kinase